MKTCVKVISRLQLLSNAIRDYGYKNKFFGITTAGEKNYVIDANIKCILIISIKKDPNPM